MTRMTIERALSAERYQMSLRAEGRYTDEEIAFIMVGFFAGWDSLEIGLEKVLESVRASAEQSGT